IELLAGRVKHKSKDITWDASVRDKIPKLMAHIFALWTLKNTQYYNEMKGASDRNTFLLQPHAAQIISILRILGIGYNGPAKVMGLMSNLVQIGTGEGKSVTLAVTASIFALLGIDVRCACYSEYLSKRDYQEFLPIFIALGVNDHIHYGTFNKLCEDIINENGDIRNRVINLIVNGDNPILSKEVSNQHPKILLVDEVDVFFNQDFYGSVYTPLAQLKDPTIMALTDHIWKRRDAALTLVGMKMTLEYRSCCTKFKGWEFLIEEAVKDMLADVKSFKSHDYLVSEDKIAYK
ncbi:unnamed protein product, partial [Didymodactylos carnosus]